MFINSYVDALTKRDSPRPLKISIIVPCHYKHAGLLAPLLNEYARQTTLPDEIVISISEVHLAPSGIVFDLQNQKWPFSLHILTCEMPLSDGGNRNRACKNATGDIFICQDADDLPHPQRTEIIKYFFETYQINHLGHGYIYASQAVFLPVDGIQQIEYQEYGPEYAITAIDLPIARGPIAISREVFDSIQWPEDYRRDNDTVFNQRVHQKFSHIVVIKDPIYLYRAQLSAWE